MKKLLVAIAAFAAVTTANAYELRVNLGNETSPGGTSATSYSNMNFGVTFLMSAEGGWGAFYQMAPEKKDGGAIVMDKWSQLGAIYQINFFSNNDFKAYMAPGVIATMAKNGTEDKTAIGVGIKNGLQWKASSAFELGFEQTIATNWTEKMLPTDMTSYALTFGFHF